MAVREATWRQLEEVSLQVSVGKSETGCLEGTTAPVQAPQWTAQASNSPKKQWEVSRMMAVALSSARKGPTAAYAK